MQTQNGVTTLSAAVAIATNASAVLEMYDMFEEFATDAALETGGAWVPFRGATELLIARAKNSEYADAISAALEKHQDKLTTGTPEATELSERLMLEALADTILKGWKNLKYKGAVLPYTRENALMLLAHNDFRLFVKARSENREYYKAKLIEAASGN